MRRRHAMPFGAELRQDGTTRFALWAPSAEKVVLLLDGAPHDMTGEPEGWFRFETAAARPGSRYGFRIGDVVVPDPASRFQPEDVSGLSAVVDPAAYEWRDGSWSGRPWEETVLYEAHVGTATPGGTFAAFAEILPGLKDLGITAVELLPVSDFAGTRNWGYDGVLPFAPDASYGTPDDLKRLVDRAHSLGIGVFLDVVYNHFGPVGNYLSGYAASFFTDRHQTPWGAGLNFDGPNGRPVRDYFIHNALYWLEEFHLDGLRFDAVHAIQDDSEPGIVAEIASRIRAEFPDRPVHLVLENERNGAALLARDEAGRPTVHTAQWDDDIHHGWHVLLTGETEAYYTDYADDPVGHLSRALAEGFAYQGEPSRHAEGKVRGEPSGHLPPSAFVSFLQNHDQVGNRAFGERLSALAAPERMRLARAGLILSPQIPMLFMGEEWDASAPFQFFVDFSADPELSRSVRDGRRREFRHFAAFSAPGAENAVPDPTDRETFRRSVLDRSEAERAPHRRVLEEVRGLIRLRQVEVVPLTKTAFLGSEILRPAEGAFDVRWRYAGGRLRFAANVGEGPVTVETGAGERVVWSSGSVPAGGGPAPRASWTGLVSVGEGE